jgi:hypothetical protein
MASNFCYGEPKRELRHEFWTLLRRIHAQWTGPWICCGDFNEVLCGDEHLGSSDRSEAQMSMFRDCIEECGLVDLGFTGPWFTWSNRQRGEDLVLVRLDRAVANAALMELFDGFRVENVITTTSDHLAISVTLTSLDDAPRQQPVQQMFRFEAAWLRAPDYREVMERSWMEGRDGSSSLQSTCDNLCRLGCLSKNGAVSPLEPYRRK